MPRAKVTVEVGRKRYSVAAKSLELAVSAMIRELKINIDRTALDNQKLED